MNVVGNVSYLIADAEKIITIDNLFYFSHIHPGESKTSNLGFTSFLSPTFFIQFFGVDPAALYHYGNTKFTSPVLAP